MSIAPVLRIALFGPLAQKDQVLHRLQEAACLQVEPLRPGPVARKGVRSDTRRALAFLLSSPVKRHPVAAGLADAEGFNPPAIEREALAIEARMQAVDEEVRALRRRLKVLQPWGDYQLGTDLLQHGLRLWFYAVPHYRMAAMPNNGLAWQVVSRDHGMCYVVVIHPTEPAGMPAPRAHTGSSALHEVLTQLHRCETEQDDLQAQRASLTRWSSALANCLTSREDDGLRATVAQQTWDEDGLFALQAWAPEAAMFELRALADELGVALVSFAPDALDRPPTLLVNHGLPAAGQTLLGIFTTPGARSWDPSSMVLISFALFFAMVIGDAGYAVVMLLWLSFRRPKRVPGQPVGPDPMRRMWWLLAAVTGIWGALIGSWFAIPLPPGSLLQRLAVLEGDNAQQMMRVSLAVGLGHLVIANLAAAWYQPGGARWGSLAWSVTLGGAGIWGFAHDGSLPLAWQRVGQMATAAGLVMALCAQAATASGTGARLIAVVAGLARLPAALGDTLSYLRLFALGFAGASLAAAFNHLGGQLVAALPGIGWLPAMLLMAFGHGLNLVLGLAGGFVHGLRLNFIEFLNWSGIEEGRPFKPFKLTEAKTWSPT